MNAHIERFNRSIQEECVKYIEDRLEDLKRFNRRILDYISQFNCERPHFGIGLKTPCQSLSEYHASEGSFNQVHLCNMWWTYTKI